MNAKTQKRNLASFLPIFPQNLATRQSDLMEKIHQFEKKIVRKFGHLFFSFWAGGFAACLENNISQDLWTINAKSFWG